MADETAPTGIPDMPLPSRQEVCITHADGKEFGRFNVYVEMITGGEWRPYTGESYREHWAGEYVTKAEHVGPDGSKMVLTTRYRLARNSPVTHVSYQYEDFDAEGKSRTLTSFMPNEQPVIHLAYLRETNGQSPGEVGHNLKLYTLYREPMATHPYPPQPSAGPNQ